MYAQKEHGILEKRKQKNKKTENNSEIIPLSDGYVINKQYFDGYSQVGAGKDPLKLIFGQI